MRLDGNGEVLPLRPCLLPMFQKAPGLGVDRGNDSVTYLCAESLSDRCLAHGCLESRRHHVHGSAVTWLPADFLCGECVNALRRGVDLEEVLMARLAASMGYQGRSGSSVPGLSVESFVLRQRDC